MPYTSTQLNNPLATFARTIVATTGATRFIACNPVRNTTKIRNGTTPAIEITEYGAAPCSTCSFCPSSSSPGCAHPRTAVIGMA